MPRAGSVPGVINHQPRPDKRAFPAVLKGPKLRSPGGFSRPQGRRDCQCYKRNPAAPQLRCLLARRGRPGCVPSLPLRCALSLGSPWLMSPVTDQRGSFPERGFGCRESCVRTQEAAPSEPASSTHTVWTPAQQGLGSPVPNPDHPPTAIDVI